MTEKGRSMVEMLGVLAIIGVLSAGAMAGYSKAMFQYKMNKTIEETTRIFQRFEEAVHKDWGGNEENYVNIYTGDDSAVQFGLLEKCDHDGSGCRLPIGSILIDAYHDPADTSMCGGGKVGHFAWFQFNFTDSKSCAAFALTHWEKMLPEEWWSPNGYIAISSESGTDRVYLYYPANNITGISTASDITEACQNSCKNGKCDIEFQYRYYC